jgi:hypothetical protein
MEHRPTPRDEAHAALQRLAAVEVEHEARHAIDIPRSPTIPTILVESELHWRPCRAALFRPIMLDRPGQQLLQLSILNLCDLWGIVKRTIQSRNREPHDSAARRRFHDVFVSPHPMQ